VIGYFGGHSVASKLTGETRVMLLSVMLNSTYCIQAMFMLPGIFLTLQDSNDVLIFPIYLCLWFLLVTASQILLPY
jgi:hypothetical protein